MLGCLRLRRGTCLAQELLDFVLAQLPVARNLDGDSAVEFRIAGLPDTAETTDSQSLDKFEVPDRWSWSRRLWSLRFRRRG